MKRTLAFAIALIAACPAAWAQESKAERILADRPGLNVVFDDDGGKVEIFRHGDAARTLEFHGGAVIREPLVQIIFLGDGWQSPLQAKKKAFLRSAIEHVTPGQLQPKGDDPFRPATFTGERELPASGTINDLRIQSAIDRAMTAGILSLRDENVIHVVFLAPGLESKLGHAAPGRDYDSYHSHFHAQDVNIRYVVVPFHEELPAMADAAAKSLVRSMINPDGDGWY